MIEGRYVVVLEDSVKDVKAETEERERRVGFKSRMRYERAVKGFSARLNQGQVRALETDPKVDFVSQDRRVKATGNVSLAPGEPTPPTGVRRILSATNTTVREASGVNVAVIDTGIQLDHPDLNAANGTDCITPGSSADDDNGHGTHVAGSVAAKNNGSGVTGVAPDTKTYAVKVLDGAGNGSLETAICGIDWVTANTATLNIKVANMSLGALGQPLDSETCSTTTDAMRKAVCNSTAAGVTHVVAAGNSGWDFDFPSGPDVPAAYPEVLTVTAMSDSDGLAGALGGASPCNADEADDRAAGYSNFALTTAGAAHAIAAPGTCILSTLPGGGYGNLSGTSMATPHMAGVMALCIKEKTVSGPCAGKTPAQNITYLRNDAQAYNNANTGYGFDGDPLRPSGGGEYYGYLTQTEVDTTAPQTSIDSGPSGATSSGSPSFGFSSSEAGSTFECKLDGPGVTTGSFGTCSSPKSYSGLGDGAYTFSVRATDPAGNTDTTAATRTFTVDTPAPAPAPEPEPEADSDPAPPAPAPPAPAPPAPAPPAPSAAACPTEDTPGYLHPAKMRVSRAQVLREDRRLDVFAPITSRARGDVQVIYQADGRSDTIDAEVTSGDAALDRIRFKESITAGQARLGTGIVTIDYKGDEDTRPEEVRLRAASQSADLDVDEISLTGDRLSAKGSVTSRAQGIVRLHYSYLDEAGEPKVHLARAKIQNDGDWVLDGGETVPPQLARCGGYLSILFTGYFDRRIRGEMLAYQLDAGQTRRP